MKLIYAMFLSLILFTTAIAQDEIPTFEEVPEEVKVFLDNSEQYPFGKRSEMAAEELEHLGKLAGIWYCDVIVNNNGNWVKTKPAFWTFKYVLDGWAIQDLWFKKLENLPKPAQAMGHDFSGINIRMYDPYKDEWKALWFTNAIKTDTTNQLYNTYDAVSTDDAFVMERNDLPEGKGNKITFYNMSEDYFDWKNEVSSDSGKTWKTTFKIEGRRIK